MRQVEGYIDSYYERIEGVKLIENPAAVMDNLLIKIVEDRPNEKKYVYSFYACLLYTSDAADDLLTV